MRIGVEVGGTFTDLVAFDGEAVRVSKVPSTPARPDQGALDAIDSLGIGFGEIRDLVHGSTVATNAILERTGARVALFVSRGTRDLLALQRHDRRRIYDLAYAKPEPVVARRDTFEIAERLAADGAVVVALDLAEAERVVVQALDGGGHDAVAICFLNAYANPAHEAAVAAIVRRHFPELAVTASHQVCREFREYERCSTTTLSAYVQPVIDGYLGRFVAELRSRGFAGRFSVMQSNGGRLPAEAMARNAITSLYSGPAAGAIGAARQVVGSGFRDLITLDMGGTSTDVALIQDGRPEITGMTEIDGLPIKTPVIDIVTVGAGGGSLVWVDDGGLMRVGPRSAGAEPGPAAYGRGGTAPTLTDGHLIRGTVRAESFLGGRMALDRDASARAYAGLAEAFSLSLEAAADAAVQIAESNIVRAIQRISTERGRDPRDYALVPFGGAGPMQAVRVAAELGIRTVVVPPLAGVLSAFGLLAADYVHYESRTRRLAVSPETLPEIRAILAELAASVSAYLADLGLAGEAERRVTLEMRFVGQAFEIPVELDPDDIADLTAEALAGRFYAAHHRVFEFGTVKRNPAEVVSFRVGAALPPDRVPGLRGLDQPAAGPSEIEIFERGERRACTRIDRAGLTGRIAGAALIEDGTSTLYLPPGWTAAPDPRQNLVITPTEGP